MEEVDTKRTCSFDLIFEVASFSHCSDIFTTHLCHFSTFRPSFTHFSLPSPTIWPTGSVHAAGPSLKPPLKIKPPLASSCKEIARDSWVATIEREYHNIELNGKTAVTPKSSLHPGWSDKHQNGMEPRENIYYTPTEVCM